MSLDQPFAFVVTPTGAILFFAGWIAAWAVTSRVRELEPHIRRAVNNWRLRRFQQKSATYGFLDEGGLWALLGGQFKVLHEGREVYLLEMMPRSQGRMPQLRVSAFISANDSYVVGLSELKFVSRR